MEFTLRRPPVRRSVGQTRTLRSLWLTICSTRITLAAVIAAMAVMASCTGEDHEPSKSASTNPPTLWTGIHSMQRQLGATMPTGRGIVVGLVESSGDNTNIRYIPNTHADQFKGVSFEKASGPSKVSGHAEATARLIFGPTGLAPGVRNAKLYQDVIDELPAVDQNAGTDWLQQCLHVRRLHFVDPSDTRRHMIMLLTDDLPPDPQGCDIFSNSWIRGGSFDCEQVLTRVDYMVDEFDTIVVAGVNNQGNTAVPPLLSSAFNVIAVGNSGRRSSTGYTRWAAATPGRCKPDIVGHMQQTSYNTPVVTAVIARLLETARQMPASTDNIDATQTRAESDANDGAKQRTANAAAKAEVIKAVLLTGADKSVGFEPENGRPLDPHHGAGAVRFDTSYEILTAGPLSRQLLEDSTITPERGWNFDSIPNSTVHLYTIKIDQPTRELCVTLTWHRRVKIHGSQGAMRDPRTNQLILHPLTQKPIYKDTVKTANLNLAVVRLDGDEVDILAKSLSRVDNVEHIYLKDLPAGNYTFNVSRYDQHDEDWDYAIAWRMD